MILTVTPNPTIDRVLFVRDFQMQDLVRAESECVSPSGKGIDVSSILHGFGADTLAIGLSAGHSGQMLAALLDERRVPYLLIPACGYTRVAALITDMATNRQSTLLAHTLTAEPSHLEQMLEGIAHHAEASWGLVCAGSVPPGLPKETHARVLDAAHRHNLVTLLDSSGEGLRLGVHSTPHILKINVAELAQLAPNAQTVPCTQNQDSTAQRIASALQPLSRQLTSYLGVWAQQAIVITMGKRGALAITDDGCWFAPAAPVPFVSPAGAGDALSAGLMLARFRGQSWRDALALGVAAASAAVMNPSTCDCDPAQVAHLLSKVEVYPIQVEDSS